MSLLRNILNINFDVPTPWGIYFQDSATPQMEGLVELHDNIMYYLVIILFAVAWIMLSIVRNYVETKSPISHKYLNHGTLIENKVPINKCSKLKNQPFKYIVITIVRSYSSQPDNNLPAKFYEDAYDLKDLIIKENKGKSGIYMLINKLYGKKYIGSSVNLKRIFKQYYNVSIL